MDAKIDTKVQFVTPSMGRCPDFILKCDRCGAEIGVVKIEWKISICFGFYV